MAGCEHPFNISTLHGTVCSTCGIVFSSDTLIDASRQNVRTVRSLKRLSVQGQHKSPTPAKKQYTMSLCGELLDQIEPVMWRQFKADVEKDMCSMKLAPNAKSPNRNSLVFMCFFVRLVQANRPSTRGLEELRTHLRLNMTDIEEAANYMAFHAAIPRLDLSAFVRFEIGVVFRSLNLEPTDYEWIERVSRLTPTFSSAIDAMPVKAATLFWLEFNYGIVMTKPSQQTQFLIDHILSSLSVFTPQTTDNGRRELILDLLELIAAPRPTNFWRVFSSLVFDAHQFWPAKEAPTGLPNEKWNKNVFAKPIFQASGNTVLPTIGGRTRRMKTTTKTT